MTRGIDLPALVRDLRRARGLTQEQLARELGVTFSTVNCWENGKHQPLPVLAKRLMEMAAASGIVKAPTPSPRRGRASRARARRRR